ncbi:helix-turn-helix domain-containing protein [Streptomyces sp. NPDC006530]|uniref:helix-turn-helix domain-containing protein n=1 Tax=Streptomyces sp. NPDC006530 TaxID=3364750 RepID=UPI0036B1CEEE
MPRWKALPEELDPRIREFAGHLRNLVDRSGLSVAAVAERTGYSKTSWERYLGGRLVAPRAAVLALAEVTGTDPVRLTALWEPAERAWSRSERRHDRATEALRIDRARSAPGGPGPTGASGRAPGGAPGRTPTGTPGGMRAQSPCVGVADRRPPVRRAPSQAPGPGHAWRRIVMFLAGVIGALLVVTSAVLLTDLGGSGPAPRAEPSPSPSAKAPAPPAGVRCVAASCTGQDPEAMGCTDMRVQTAGSAKVGAAVVEVRYSGTCRAAWARLRQAVPGDRAQIFAAGTAGGTVVADSYRDVYTKMLAVDGPAAARSCATLRNGRSGCAPGRALASPSGGPGAAAGGH